MKTFRFSVSALPFILGGFVCSGFAAETPNPAEAEYYKITTFPTPPGTALEVSSVELLPNGKIAVGTRRGEVWIASNAQKSTAQGIWNATTSTFQPVDGPRGGVDRIAERFRPPAAD